MSIQWAVRILFLSLAIQFSHQQTTDCSFSDNCDTSERDAHIVCVEGATPPCECQDDPLIEPGNTCASDVDVSAVTATDMDATKCEGLCTLSSTCMFWKYKSIGPALAEQKNCFLMNKDQCQAAEDAECEAPKCASGDLDGVSTTTCEVPSCPGPITETPDNGDNFVQKWECYISTGNFRDVNAVDMYATDAAMPLGGFCKLNMDDGGR